MGADEGRKGELKEQAAVRAVSYVQGGMKVGLGTGSTARYAVIEVARRVREGLDIVGVPTSEETRKLAGELGVPLSTLEECPQLDVTIDGADEVALPGLDAIKGKGGALLREKIVALASRSLVLIVDESKVVQRLGEKTPVPVEVVAFGWIQTCRALEALGCKPQRRTLESGEPARTDAGNYLIDCRFDAIPDPQSTAERIKAITGVVEHGLFLGIAARLVIAGEGGVRIVEK